MKIQQLSKVQLFQMLEKDYMIIKINMKKIYKKKKLNIKKVILSNLKYQKIQMKF